MMADEGQLGAWGYRVIIDRLEAIGKNQDEMNKALSDMRVEVAVLKTKLLILCMAGSSVIGTIVSIIVAIIMHR